jgi:hypothetical protein
MSGFLHSRSCDLAYRLQGSTPRLLNQLCHLGEGTLVIRQQGLSLAKVTGFGLFVASEHGGWNVLRDAISGLEADLGRAHQVHLLADPDDARPVFSINPPGNGIELSVRLDRHDWKSRPMREMVDAFQGITIDARDRISLDVGAWLDEWERPSPRDKGIDWNIAAALDECRCLEVEVKTGMHRVKAAFRPAFLDSEGPVLRIADAARKHVIFADTAAPGFRWSSLAPGHLRIQVAMAERIAEAVAAA